MSKGKKPTEIEEIFEFDTYIKAYYNDVISQKKKRKLKAQYKKEMYKRFLDYENRLKYLSDTTASLLQHLTKLDSMALLRMEKEQNSFPFSRPIRFTATFESLPAEYTQDDKTKEKAEEHSDIEQSDDEDEAQKKRKEKKKQINNFNKKYLDKSFYHSIFYLMTDWLEEDDLAENINNYRDKMQDLLISAGVIPTSPSENVVPSPYTIEKKRKLKTKLPSVQTPPSEIVRYLPPPPIPPIQTPPPHFPPHPPSPIQPPPPPPPNPQSQILSWQNEEDNESPPDVHTWQNFPKFLALFSDKEWEEGNSNKCFS